MINPIFIICKRAVEEGMFSDKEAFRMAFAMREVFDQCTPIDIDAFLKENVRTTYDEAAETAEWFKQMYGWYEEERKRNKKRFNLKK